ncbi:Cytochrome b-c1 complex subunit 7, partial [Trachymyrmex septentrionalis]
KLAFNSMKFNRYELYMDDMLYYDNLINYYYTSLIHKALRRLPEEVLVARNFRLIRALQLNFLKIYLPREKWVTYEQDIEYRYLKPYIEEIEAEINEFDYYD